MQTGFCLGFPNHNIFSEKFDSKLPFEDHVRGIVAHVSQRICILRLVKRDFVDTSVLMVKLLLRFY